MLKVNRNNVNIDCVESENDRNVRTAVESARINSVKVKVTIKIGQFSKKQKYEQLSLIMPMWKTS